MSATRHTPWTILGRVALGIALVLSLPGLATPAPAPGVGQWTPTAPAGAPEARWQHAAVWTGSRMIVWGGASATDEPNTGLSSTPTPKLDAHEHDGALSCYDPRAVWTGSKMIVGGALSYDWLNVGRPRPRERQLERHRLRPAPPPPAARPRSGRAPG